jgi:hypothetical protein
VKISRVVRVGIGVVAVTAFAGLLIWWVWLPSQLGDPEKSFLHVANQTDELLTVVQLGGGEIRAEIAEVPAHSTIETYLPCGAAELIAENRDGVVVARRPPSEECNLKTWVVEPVND